MGIITDNEYIKIKKEFNKIIIPKHELYDPKLYHPVYEGLDSVLKALLDQSANNPERWKLPEIPDEPGDSKKEPSSPAKQYSRAEILDPLGKVFLDDDLKDDLVVHAGIEALLDGTQTSDFSGIIMYGPPGTGKTVMLDALVQVYGRAGAYAKKLSLSSLNQRWVGSFAENVEKEIQKALKEAERTGKPSFLAFDEASSLIQIADDGAVSVSKHYQEVIEVLKRYIGNDRRLVIAVSTNMLMESMEAALVREGRLATYLIGYPGQKQRADMWKHFLVKQEIRSDFTDEQYLQLAALTDEKQGAFIEEFCRSYDVRLRKRMVGQHGHRTYLEAMAHGVKIDTSSLKKEVAFEDLCSDIGQCIEERKRMNGNGNGNGDGKKPKPSIGFVPAVAEEEKETAKA